MVKVDKRSKDSVYITIGKWVIYIDNSTGEHIIESWKEWSANINKEKAKSLNFGSSLIIQWYLR